MSHEKRKLVFAPLGADDYGDDILLFEHGVLLALQTAAEKARAFTIADVHDALKGDAKRESPTAPLSEPDIRALAARADCDTLIDGMLTCTRDPQTGALTQISVALRLFDHAGGGHFHAPPALAFRAFFPDDRPDTLSLDYDLFIALQYRLCEGMLDALNVNIPPHFTTDDLQATADFPAYLLFVKALRVAANPQTKLGYYEQALKRDPDFLPAVINSATLLKSQTDFHAARTRYAHAVTLTRDPETLGEIYFQLGLCSISLGDPKTARSFWNRALEHGLESPTLYINMAGTYEQEENLPEAIRMNEAALQRFPDTHKAIVNLARLHAMRGDLDRAITLYERAVELQPDDALRHSVLGGCLLAAGRDEEARPHFERAVLLAPDTDPGRYAAQELNKIGPAPSPDGEDAGPKKKRWGLF